MKYLDAVKELEQVNLKDKFESKFQEVSVDYFNALKNIDYIHSLPSLIRSLISFLDYGTNEYDFWVSVLNYFMLPEFERENKPFNF